MSENVLLGDVAEPLDVLALFFFVPGPNLEAQGHGVAVRACHGRSAIVILSSVTGLSPESQDRGRRRAAPRRWRDDVVGRPPPTRGGRRSRGVVEGPLGTRGRARARAEQLVAQPVVVGAPVSRGRPTARARRGAPSSFAASGRGADFAAGAGRAELRRASRRARERQAGSSGAGRPPWGRRRGRGPPGTWPRGNDAPGLRFSGFRLRDRCPTSASEARRSFAESTQSFYSRSSFSPAEGRGLNPSVGRSGSLTKNLLGRSSCSRKHVVAHVEADRGRRGPEKISWPIPPFAGEVARQHRVGPTPAAEGDVEIEVP